jgi:hypothetical protein
VGAPARRDPGADAPRRSVHPRGRWVWVTAAVAASCLVVAGVVVIAGDEDASDVAGSSTTAVRSPTTATPVTTTTGSATTASTAVSTTGPPTTSTMPTTTGTPATSTTAPVSSTTGEGPVPAAVDAVDAGSGGGSGEVALDRGAASGAAASEVLRSDDEDGPFAIAAEIDVVTGTASAADDVVNVWSPQHSYVPTGGALDR